MLRGETLSLKPYIRTLCSTSDRACLCFSTNPAVIGALDRDVKAERQSVSHRSREIFATEAGDFPRIVLGVAVMSVFVILFNRLAWRPLFGYAERRLRLT